MAAADLDGDLKLDLAVTSRDAVALAAGSMGIDTRPAFVATVDWNRDGKIDLITASQETGKVSLWVNQR